MLEMRGMSIGKQIFDYEVVVFVIPLCIWLEAVEYFVVNSAKREYIALGVPWILRVDFGCGTPWRVSFRLGTICG